LCFIGQRHCSSDYECNNGPILRDGIIPGQQQWTNKTVHDSHEKHIAAQALRALDLRRQFDRGDLTYQEYFDHLNAFEGTPAPAAAQGAAAEPSREPGDSQSRPGASEPPKLIGALAVLQLRRRLDNGELTPQQYLAQLDAEPEAHVSTPEPALTPMAKGPAIFTTQAIPARSLAMKCLRCAADLRIYDRMTEFECVDCGAEMFVERKDCTITLRLAEELPVETDAIAVAAASGTAGEALRKLRAEAAMVTNINRSAGILGGLCGVLFAYLGFAGMAARNIAMGASVLCCGSALLGTVVCITRHTTKVRAELTARIHAINAGEDSDDEFSATAITPAG
jgi:predicted RNA-binding Zn-ribbon protein involved in translation (DUF1610 family)